MSPPSASLYLILGAAGSGRREIVADLLDGGGDGPGQPLVLLEATEAPAAADARLPEVARWQWRDGQFLAPVPPGNSPVFLLLSGWENPVEQLDQFQHWLAQSGLALARILCVVHCQLAERHPALLAWYEACIHFSDVVLLNRREGVANKWVSDFRRHFEKQFYPCLFELVKGGRVDNPARVLVPEARRLTHVFEDEPEWILTNAEGETIDEEDETAEGEEEVEATPVEDIYFARDAAGRRARRIPEIRKFLVAPEPASEAGSRLDEAPRPE